MYPHVDAATCINCGLCEKVCPVLNQNETRRPNRVFAAINKDDQVRLKSSSGGIFTLLAEKVITQGGVVFGAKFDKNWQVVITPAETLNQITAFRGSKYLQARVDDSYMQCRQYLEAGRVVLYTGTPCQIAGLHRFLRRQYDNLVTVDFICHGVPSPGVWKRYLDEVLGAGKKAIQDVNFRNKSNGWKRFSFAIDYREGNDTVSLVSPLDKNPYMQVFLNDIILRPSCYNCPAKASKSHSDITIADFWGIQNVLPSMDDDKGTSLCLVNSEKGENLIPYEKIRHESATMDALRYNAAYNHSAKPNPKRDDFFMAFEKNEEDLHRIIAHSLRLTPKQKVKRLLRYPVVEARKLVKMLICKSPKNTTGGGILYNDEMFNYPSSTFQTSSISFRDKRQGWRHYVLRIDLKKIK